MKRHLFFVRFIVFAFASMMISGCISVSYHSREVTGRASPRCYPGFMYYFRGVPDGFGASYRREIVQNIPLGLFTPLFMVLDFCSDTVFLPFDFVLQACSTENSVKIENGERMCIQGSKQMLFLDASESKIALDCTVRNGAVIIKGQKGKKSSLDCYLPLEHTIVLLPGNDDSCTRREDRFVVHGHAQLELMPPVFNVWREDNRWRVSATGADGTSSDVVFVSDLEFIEPYTGCIKLDVSDVSLIRREQ